MEAALGSPAEVAHCLRKQAFRSITDADAAACRASARTGERIVSYRCDYHPGHWHIGHARPDPSGSSNETTC